MPLRNLCVLIVALLALAGCERQNSVLPYEVREGVVVERHSDTGELAVRVLQHRRDRTEERTVFCIATKDSEIYINDVLSRLDAVEPGDSIELVGYRDPNPGLERFVVSFAHITQARGDIGQRGVARNPVEERTTSMPTARVAPAAAGNSKEP